MDMGVDHPGQEEQIACIDDVAIGLEVADCGHATPGNRNVRPALASG
jgi:hypothetical protein